MAQGFVCLVAVMDWFSRYVISWSLSLTMELDFCVEALKRALRRGQPEIFNSDQGSQLTSEKFTGELRAREIAISMDGRGRCMDNIFIERLWRSLKYEEVYLKDSASVTEARAGIERYLRFTIMSDCTRASATRHRRRCTRQVPGRESPEDKEDGITEHGDSVPEPLRFCPFGPEWLF
jgi:transposase InsO family protein